MLNKRISFQFFIIFLVLTVIIAIITTYLRINSDAIAYLNGDLLFLSNQADGGINRTSITAYIFFNFGKLFPTAEIAASVYAIISAFFFYKEYSFIVSRNKKTIRTININDMFIFTPFVMVYILLPGKESLTFHLAALSILIYKGFFKPIKSKFKRFFLVFLVHFPMIIIRPNLLLILPFFYKVNFLDFHKSNVRRKWYVLSTRNFILYGTTFALSCFLFLNINIVTFTIEQIIFQSGYVVGSTSTGVISTEFDLVNFNQIFPLLLQASILGIPLGFSFFYSLKFYIVALLYVITNIISLKYILYCLEIRKHGYANFVISTLLIILIFISFFVSSSAMLVNAATGARYAGSIFALLWLCFINKKQTFRN